MATIEEWKVKGDCEQTHTFQPQLASLPIVFEYALFARAIEI